MPVYDYSCVKGHRFEVFQSMSDTPLKKCEECGAKSERVLHAPAIHFKGSGFHNTDYGTKTRPVGGGSAAILITQAPALRSGLVEPHGLATALWRGVGTR